MVHSEEAPEEPVWSSRQQRQPPLKAIWGIYSQHNKDPSVSADSKGVVGEIKGEEGNEDHLAADLFYGLIFTTSFSWSLELGSAASEN